MINHNSQLKVQAYLDGELPAREAAEVKDWLDRDPEAQALLAELRNTNGALVGHETGVKLPESREFFWSKIEREIECGNRHSAHSRSISWLTWVRLHLAPVAGVVVLSCLLAVMVVRSDRVSGQFAETELASDDMGSYTFRDQQHRMTMVWFYDRNDGSMITEPSALASMKVK